MRREIGLLVLGFLLQLSPLIVGNHRLSVVLQLTGIAFCLSALWFQGRRHRRSAP